MFAHLNNYRKSSGYSAMAYAALKIFFFLLFSHESHEEKESEFGTEQEQQHAAALQGGASSIFTLHDQSISNVWQWANDDDEQL